MAIYVIADLHLSLGTNKPMDVFKGWNNYVEKIKFNWQSVVKMEDTVIIPGDISWAMQLEECKKDFEFINSLNGKKILLKGNHDYWWTTMKKMNEFVEKNNFTTISFLFNNCYIVENIAICGTRSWFFETGEEQDLKVINREYNRLKMSLDMAKDNEKIVFLHYPPMFQNISSENIINLLKENNVKKCYYGHLHGEAIKYATQKNINGIEYKLISADSLDFMPYKLN